MIATTTKKLKSYKAQALSDYVSLMPTVSAEKFYRDVFPVGALADITLKEKDKFAGRIFRDGELSRFVNDDLKEILKCNSEQFATMNCIAYAGFGENPKASRELYAMIFRVLLPDEIKPFYVKSCLERMDYVPDYNSTLKTHAPRIRPTYILTDQAFHFVYFCYILRSPIPMYYHIHDKIQHLYDALSRAIHQLWDLSEWDNSQKKIHYIYECKKPMPESIFQAYPVVGSKLNGGAFTAYKSGQKYSLAELNLLVPQNCRLELYDSTTSLEKAKEKYPTWYERRIVQHRKPSKNRDFIIKPEVYAWFMNKVRENLYTIKLGAMEALASYAVKTGTSRYKLIEDLDALHAMLSARFTEDDILEHKERALDFYENSPHIIIKWGTKGISKWSGLEIVPNKRNFRTQKEHLKLLHNSQSFKDKVLEWYKTHPDGTQTQCSAELEISRKTVSKWWPTRQKKKKSKNLCPLCGAEMTKTKIEPYFWPQKSKFYTRIDSDCPNCHLYLQGKSYPCKRPAG